MLNRHRPFDMFYAARPKAGTPGPVLTEGEPDSVVHTSGPAVASPSNAEAPSNAAAPGDGGPQPPLEKEKGEEEKLSAEKQAKAIDKTTVDVEVNFTEQPVIDVKKDGYKTEYTKTYTERDKVLELKYDEGNLKTHKEFKTGVKSGVNQADKKVLITDGKAKELTNNLYLKERKADDSKFDYVTDAELMTMSERITKLLVDSDLATIEDPEVEVTGLIRDKAFLNVYIDDFGRAVNEPLVHNIGQGIPVILPISLISYLLDAGVTVRIASGSANLNEASNKDFIDKVAGQRIIKEYDKTQSETSKKDVYKLKLESDFTPNDGKLAFSEFTTILGTLTTDAEKLKLEEATLKKLTSKEKWALYMRNAEALKAIEFRLEDYVFNVDEHFKAGEIVAKTVKDKYEEVITAIQATAKANLKLM